MIGKIRIVSYHDFRSAGLEKVYGVGDDISEASATTIVSLDFSTENIGTERTRIIHLRPEDAARLRAQLAKLGF